MKNTFTVEGKGFGARKGRVYAFGDELKVTSWSDTLIKGKLPKGAFDVETKDPTADGDDGIGRIVWGD